MKYFTMAWWLELQDSYNPPTKAPLQKYEDYLSSIRAQLPSNIQNFLADVSLHDAHLLAFHHDCETRTLTLDLRVCREHDTASCELHYSDVRTFEMLTSEEPLPPLGLGDLGYDEWEQQGAGFYQHRMLFSSGVEFAVSCAEFTYHFEPPGLSKS